MRKKISTRGAAARRPASTNGKAGASKRDLRRRRRTP